MSEFQPKFFKCVEPGCNVEFEFSVREQEYFAKNLTRDGQPFKPPRRCKEHRVLQRQRHEGRNVPAPAPAPRDKDEYGNTREEY